MLKLKQIIPGMLASLSFAVIASVEAATVVNLDDDNNVVSIDDLKICISSPDICEKTPEELEENETQIIDSYNVVFPPGRFDLIFADPTQPDFVGSCDNGLCFWGNPVQAALAIMSINQAINELDPVPFDVVGDLVFPPFPAEPTINNFYRVPLNYNESDGLITSRQGTNNDGDPENPWVLDTLRTNPILATPSYAEFQFIGREVITPPAAPGVPEPSSLMGIFVISGSVLMTIKKKN
ncbi:hypothetical protein [Crocosphaera sp.]|uniref:hypothetical protein n=1 Tax=Crocosphaera sp. TaxID=2729996 RepID=UPI003F2942C6|nr:hypothetical protein [Crocosphaera sp.]